MEGSWDLLSDDLNTMIVSILWTRKDRSSLHALMMTSSQLRLLVSSLISKVQINDTCILLQAVPKHATIRTLDLSAMRPSQATQYMSGILAAGAEVRHRLLTVNSVIENFGTERSMDSISSGYIRSMEASIEIIARACPALRSLEATLAFSINIDFGVPAVDHTLTAAFFRCLGRHLPGLQELEVHGNERGWDPECNWAKRLPSGLQKLCLHGAYLNPRVLQHLVKKPHLVELKACSLTGGVLGLQIQSEGCTWKILRLEYLPSFKDINMFTTWPKMDLKLSRHEVGSAEWYITLPDPEQTSAVAGAAARLASSVDSSSFLGDINLISDINEARTSDPGLLAAMAPLATKLSSITLTRWTVGSEVLNSLVSSLPGVRSLTLEVCEVDESFWQMLLSCFSIENLSLSQTPVALSQLVDFSSRVPRAMGICVARTCVELTDDWKALKAFRGSLGEQRVVMGLPPVSIMLFDS